MTPSRLQKPQEKNPNKEQNLKLRSYKKTDFFSISHYKATLRHKKINDLKLIYATKWKLIQSQRKRIEKSEAFYFLYPYFISTMKSNYYY